MPEDEVQLAACLDLEVDVAQGHDPGEPGIRLHGVDAQGGPQVRPVGLLNAKLTVGRTPRREVEATEAPAPCRPGGRR